MTYPEFIQEMTDRFGDNAGLIMAMRAEIGFLRKYLEERGGAEFAEKQEAMIKDFLERHPRP
jgi:hypothetical protein